VFRDRWSEQRRATSGERQAASWKLTAEEKDEVDRITTGGSVPSPERPPYG
jgi:hypothetical protein